METVPSNFPFSSPEEPSTVAILRPQTIETPPLNCPHSPPSSSKDSSTVLLLQPKPDPLSIVSFIYMFPIRLEKENAEYMWPQPGTPKKKQTFCINTQNAKAKGAWFLDNKNDLHVLQVNIRVLSYFTLI